MFPAFQSTTSAPLPERPRSLRRWGANLAIVGWLLIAAHQAGPFVPDRIAKSIGLNRIARALGIWQHRWPMFAPDPDNHNQALEAVITFSDGATEVWRTPDWRTVGALERFLNPRDPKFFENLEGTIWSAAWPAFARDIGAEVRGRNPNRGQVRRVELYLEIARIDRPEDRWQSWRESTPVTERHLFHVEELP